MEVQTTIPKFNRKFTLELMTEICYYRSLYGFNNTCKKYDITASQLSLFQKDPRVKHNLKIGHIYKTLTLSPGDKNDLKFALKTALSCYKNKKQPRKENWRKIFNDL